MIDVVWCSCGVGVALVSVVFRSDFRNRKKEDTSRKSGRDQASVISSRRSLNFYLDQPPAPPTPHTQAAIASASVPRVLLSLNTCCPSPLAFSALGDTHDPSIRAAQPSITTAQSPSQRLHHGSVRLPTINTAVARLLMHRQLGRIHRQDVDGRRLAIAARTTRQLLRVAIDARARRLRPYHGHPEPLRIHP